MIGTEEEEEEVVVDSEEENSENDADSEVVSGGPLMIDRFGTDERIGDGDYCEALDALESITQAEPDEAPLQ